MKRFAAMALCALLLFACGVSCAQEGALITSTQEVLSLIIAGEYAQVVSRFDETMAQAVDEAALKDAWNSVTALLGGVTDVAGAQEDAAAHSAALLLTHERGSTALLLVFDSQGRIAGMSITPQSAAAQPVERTLPDGVTAQAAVLFAGTDRELAGELLIPAGADENTPYAVLVHGSGPSDMNETIGANQPFRDLAYDLSAQGVGSIRFDKVTYAHPELPVETVKQEYLEPVQEALAVLRAQTGAQHVYLIGHSQGGMLAPYLVEGCGFDGGVALAGTPKQLWEISYAQNLALLAAMPENPQHDIQLALIEAERQKALTLAQMTDEIAAAETVFGVSAVYQRHLAQMDQAQIALKCGKPFLFLWGECDFQVDRAAFDAWHERLGESERFTYRTYSGLNHLFMPAGEEDSILNAQAAYQQPKQVNGQVAKDIAAWLMAQQ